MTHFKVAIPTPYIERRSFVGVTSVSIAFASFTISLYALAPEGFPQWVSSGLMCHSLVQWLFRAYEDIISGISGEDSVEPALWSGCWQMICTRSGSGHQQWIISVTLSFHLPGDWPRMCCLSMMWVSKWAWQIWQINTCVIMGWKKWPSKPSFIVRWWAYFGTMLVRWWHDSIPKILCPSISNTCVTVCHPCDLGSNDWGFSWCIPWSEWWWGWHK